MARKVVVSGEPFGVLSDGSKEVTASPSTFPQVKVTRGIEIVAYSTNTEGVYVSRRPNVTADETITGGFLLLPGSSVFFPALDMQDVYLISVSGGQRISFLGY